MPTALNKLLVVVHSFILFCEGRVCREIHSAFFCLHKRFLFINFAETLNKTTMATFEIKDAKKQIILYKGKEYRVDVLYTGRNFWVYDAETGEKIVKWDYTKYTLYDVWINDSGILHKQMFLDPDEAIKVYDAYVEYYRKLAEIKQPKFKIKVKEEKLTKLDIEVYGKSHRDCTIDISTPMYSKVISITCNRFRL